MIEHILEKKKFEDVYKTLENKFRNSKTNMLELEKCKLNEEHIINEILNKQYEVDLLDLTEIIDYNGRRKIASNLSMQDMVVSYLIMQFLKESYPLYCQEDDIIKWLETIKQYILEESKYVCRIYIQNFFESINHHILVDKFEKLKIDNLTISLLKSFLNCEIKYDNIYAKMSKGIIQDFPFSMLLANIYLDEFDKELKSKMYKFIRVNDYILIFDTNKKDLLDKIQYIKKVLRETVKLSINDKKVFVDNIYNIGYFGYKLIKKNNKIDFVKEHKIEDDTYTNQWKSSSIRRENNEYHIINNGILDRKDFSILFENEDKKVYLPVEVVSTINVYSNIAMTSNFFDYINEKNIIVNYYNKNGKYIGKFLPQTSQKSALTVLNQVEVYNNTNKRVELAKNILQASIYNFMYNMKYYNRRYGLKIDDSITKIAECMLKIKKIKEYNKLLLLEARAREIYYSTFNKIIKNNQFAFIKRTKRPPKDRINCLISFGNALLYNFIAKEIYKTTLDIRIAYLHASNNRYESLNLDIADIFKPVIVDKIIFSLINKKLLTHICILK